jgi:carbamoyltransferase
MYILGLSTMTESSAALHENGRLVAAAEEERFSRRKHDGGFPLLAIESVLHQAGIGFADLDHVAVYWDPFQLGYRSLYMLETLLRQPGLFLEKARRAVNIWQGTAGESSGWGSLFTTRHTLESRFGPFCGRLHYLDHHECHMAAAYYGSGFDDAAILIMDGAGEAACTTTAVGRGVSMRKLDEHRLPHSLGHFYSAVTGYLGFKMLDGEYKMMGMSPYGDPKAAAWIRANQLITTRPGRYTLNTAALDYHRALRGIFRGDFVDYFGPPRAAEEEAPFTDTHRDIAASAQAAFEEVVLDLARHLGRTTRSRQLVVAGGCGLNCVANGKLLERSEFEQVYVPPVPNDAGGSLGAAMLLYYKLTGQRPEPIRHAQFGPEYATSDIQQALTAHPNLTAQPLSDDALLDSVVDILTRGGVVGWHQGRMEYGPRALGNRSFLADPRSDSIRDTINQKIKKRELFRPFAPSVKAEVASDYFELQQPSPFMTIVVPVRPHQRDAIVAVTHVDGTARPQTVAKGDNPLYWALLDRFEQRTGIPVLLNTSFNIQEPIVCTPEHALRTFERSTTDALAIGSFLITRCEGKRVRSSSSGRFVRRPGPLESIHR